MQVNLSGIFFSVGRSHTREFPFYLSFSLSRERKEATVDRLKTRIVICRLLNGDGGGGGGSRYLLLALCAIDLFAFKQNRTLTQSFEWNCIGYVGFFLLSLNRALMWVELSERSYMSWMQSSWFCSVLVTRSFTADHQLSRLLRFSRFGSVQPVRYSIIL